MATNILWVATSGRAGAAGTEAAPLKSIQEAINHAAPGTTIMVKSGVYNENLTFNSGTSGSSGAPITIVSADGRGAAEIRPADTSRDTIRFNAADYITLDGLKVAGGNANTIHATMSGQAGDENADMPTHITLQNMNITGGRLDGVKVSWGDYITVRNSYITGSSNEEGIDFVGVQHGVIDHNDVSNVGSNGAAIQAKGGSLDIDITNNKVHSNDLYGILVGGWTDTIYVRAGTGSYETKGIDVIGNEISSTARNAMRVVGADDARIEDNWMRGSGSNYLVDVITSSGTHTAWASGDVTFSGNSADKSSWLNVQSGAVQQSGNKIDGSAPADWSTFTIGVQTGTVLPPSTPAPTPTPEPTPTPTPEPTPTPTPEPTPTPTPGSTINGNHGANTLTGTSGADTIYGNGGNDVIAGNGGNDALFGGSGLDTFVFNTKPSSSNIDRVGDFSTVNDTIRLDNAVFTKLTKTGTVASSFFKVADKAADSNDYIVYNKTTGALSYDADGSGAGAAVQFAKLKAGLSMTASDFVII